MWTFSSCSRVLTDFQKASYAGWSNALWNISIVWPVAAWSLLRRGRCSTYFWKSGCAKPGARRVSASHSRRCPSFKAPPLE